MVKKEKRQQSNKTDRHPKKKGGEIISRAKKEGAGKYNWGKDEDIGKQETSRVSERD